jgi:lipoic acid synthetase
LLGRFKAAHPAIPTKSGLMVGLGETDDEIHAAMRDMRLHKIDMITIGQYLAPSVHHLPVSRYVEPTIFDQYRDWAERLGFKNAAIGPLIRSSYHADRQADQAGVAGHRP